MADEGNTPVILIHEMTLVCLSWVVRAVASNL